MNRQTDSSRLLHLAQRGRILTARGVRRLGVHSQALTRLAREGKLERVARGQYRLPDYPITENHALVIVAKAAPHGVICLLTALRFHDIGTQLPYEVWVAIDGRARRPSIDYPRLRIVRFGGRALTEGIETHRIEGEDVRVYCPAKTVADCFKYRNKVGLDVAMEALRGAWRARRFTMDEIDHYARVCRVEHVMRPYLEGLVA